MRYHLWCLCRTVRYLRWNIWLACIQMQSISCFLHQLMPCLAFLSWGFYSLLWIQASLYLVEPWWMHRAHRTSSWQTSREYSVPNTLPWLFQSLHLREDHQVLTSCISIPQWHHHEWSSRDVCDLQVPSCRSQSADSCRRWIWCSWVMHFVRW